MRYFLLYDLLLIRTDGRSYEKLTRDGWKHDPSLVFPCNLGVDKYGDTVLVEELSQEEFDRAVADYVDHRN